ncbi:MAG: MFS transporter, partial [Pseudomonadota bacterium]
MTDATKTDSHVWPASATAWYTVAVLLIAYTFAYVDRAILTILVEPIQADLNLNDTQIGLLHGFAFVIFYVSLGVPLGYVADRFNRKHLIAGSVALWSVMTALCGMTHTFWQLFAARVGVGVGEAGLSPAGYSMISDCFPPKRRSLALGIYTIGIYLGSGLAILGGGLVVGLIGTTPSVEIPVLG